MGVITRNILTGLITLLPITLTLYLIYWLVVTTEQLLGQQLMQLLPGVTYRPGFGFAIGLMLCFAIGLLMNTYVVRKLFEHAERLFLKLPVVRLVYPPIRDFVDYFSPVKKKDFDQVVAVTLADTGMEVIGLVTQSDPQRMPQGLDVEDKVLVYLPMSYMIGGYTVLVPKSAVKSLDMSMDEAMRFILTAGVTGARKSDARPTSQPPNPDLPTHD